MKKRVLLILVMICVVMGGAFAQAKKPAASANRVRKNAVSLDAFQFFGSFVPIRDKAFSFAFPFSYERLIVPHFSIGANLDPYFGISTAGKTVVNVYFGLNAEARIYPTSENLSGMFFGTTLGVDMYMADGKLDEKKGGYFGLNTSIKTGYKYIFSKGIFLEPSLAYVFSKAGAGIDISGIPGAFKGSLRVGFAF